MNNIINIKGGKKNEKKLIPSIIIAIIMGIVLLNSVMLSGCNQEGSNPIMRGRSAGNIIGKVANDFGNSLNRDIDEDGDNDSAVVLNNIAGGNDDDSGRSLTIDSTGKIYVTGWSWGSNSAGSNDDMYVIRLNRDGSIDNSFGVNGKVVVHNIAGGNGNDVGNSLTIDSTGKIYVTGYSYNGRNWNMYVIKIE